MKGQVIFSHGDSGGHAYLIRSGEIALYKTTDGAKQLITHMKPGQILGEMAIITGQPRSATAEALESTELLRIDNETLQFVLNKSTPFIKALINQLIRRIQAGENTANSVELT